MLDQNFNPMQIYLEVSPTDFMSAQDFTADGLIQQGSFDMQTNPVYTYQKVCIPKNLFQKWLQS